MSCDRKDCTNDAAVAPKIMIPATGYQIEDHTPISAILGLTLCLGCCHCADPQELLVPEVRAMIDHMTLNRVPPDYARAWIVAVPLGSDEYLEHLERIKNAT